MTANWSLIDPIEGLYIIPHLIPICLAFHITPPSCIQELRYFCKALDSNVHILGCGPLDISFIPLHWFGKAGNRSPSVLSFSVKNGNIKYCFRLSIRQQVVDRLAIIEKAICLKHEKLNNPVPQKKRRASPKSCA